MPSVTLAIISGLYTFTAVGYLKEGKVGLGVCFLAYAVANLGLIWEGMK